MRLKLLITFVILPSLALVVIIAYSNSYQIPFHWDDVYYYEQNPGLWAVKSFGDISSFQCYRSRPVANFFIGLNYWWSGYRLGSWHLFTMLSHIAMGAVVFWLAWLIWQRAVGGEQWIGPWFTALLFVANPIHNETLNMFHFRAEIYAGLFCVLSITLFLLACHHCVGWKRWLCWSGSFVSALLAAGSKENAIILPALAFLTDRFFYGGNPVAGSNFWRWRLRYLARYIPLVLAVALVPLMLLTLPYPHQISVGFGVAPYKTFLLTQLTAIPWYIRYLLVPYPLNLDHDFPYRVSLDVWVVLSLIFLAGLIATIIRQRVKRPLLSFALAWFLIAKFPTSFTLPMSESFVERFMYLPAVGFCLACAYLLYALARYFLKVTGSPRIVWGSTGVVVGAILILSSASIYRRNTAWQDRLSLWEDTTLKSPMKSRSWSNLGHEWEVRGNLAKAGRAFRKAFELEEDPNDTVLMNYGISLAWSDNYEEAEEIFLRIFKLPPKKHYHVPDYLVWYNLAMATFRQEAYSRALSYLDNIKTYKTWGRGGGFDIYCFYGQILRYMGRPAEALKKLQLALQYKGYPHEKVKLEMARILLELGDIPSARTLLLELSGQSVEARKLLESLEKK